MVISDPQHTDGSNLTEERLVLYLCNNENNVPSRLSCKGIVAAHALGHMIYNYKLLALRTGECSTGQARCIK